MISAPGYCNKGVRGLGGGGGGVLMVVSDSDFDCMGRMVLQSLLIVHSCYTRKAKETIN